MRHRRRRALPTLRRRGAGRRTYRGNLRETRPRTQKETIDFASRGSVLHGSTTGSKHKPHPATTCFFEPEIRRRGTYFCDLYQILNKSSKNLHNQNVKLSLFRKGYEIGKTAMEIHSPDADSAGIPLYQGAWDAYTRFFLQTVFRNRGRARVKDRRTKIGSHR